MDQQLLFDLLLAAICLGLGIGLVLLWYRCALWTIADMHLRIEHLSPARAFTFFALGPIGAALWYIIRPASLVGQQTEEEPRKKFPDTEMSLAMAGKLQQLGELDAALRIYLSIRDDYPEHAAYAQDCIDAIQAKQSSD